MLELRGVAALGVAQRGVGVHDAQVAQVLQRHQVLGLAQAVQPAAAERQRAEVLVDHVEQVLRSGQPGEDAACRRYEHQNMCVCVTRRESQVSELETKLLPDGDVAHVKVLHVVGALHVVVHHPLTRAAKRLDGVNFSLLRRKNNPSVTEKRPSEVCMNLHSFVVSGVT